MKKLLKTLILPLTLTGLVLLSSCGKDDDNVTDPGDPNDFCNVELCMTNGTLKTVCIDEYNDCVALAQRSKEECALLATETCTI